PALEQEPRTKRAEHILRAVGEVDDVEQSEDHREAEREHGIERAVDQPDKELTEQGLRRETEDFSHCGSRRVGPVEVGASRPLTGRYQDANLEFLSFIERDMWSRGGCRARPGSCKH